jgi:glutathione S-transferase
LRLFIGNRNYSSWSMRAWLALRLTGAEFEEELFPLGEAGVRDRIRKHSPTGRVPALRDRDLTLWDSLAIAEYLAERFPRAGLWPSDREARARARAVCAEMHSGFSALRANMPFNVRRRSPGKGRAPGVEQDIERIVGLWRECLSSGDPFLFGEFGLADAFYAPVVIRFRTYAVPLAQPEAAWADRVLEHEHVWAWCEAAEAEPWSEPQYDL